MESVENRPFIALSRQTDAQKKLRLFVSDRSILIMAAVAITGLSLALRRGDTVALVLVAFGWAIYVVEEYLLHRFVFHAAPPRNQFLFDVLYRLHYGHHDQVSNKDLLFTPLWFSLPLAAVDISVLSIILPFADSCIAVAGGGVSAYLVFEWLHLTSHFKASSKGRLGRYITRRHSKHHYIDYARWFTVSPGGQLVDKALGSDPCDYSVVPNVHTCGLPKDDPRLVRSRQRFGYDTTLANKSNEVVGVRAEQAA